MKNTVFVSLIVVAGCTPLQQAPLMYTSKQVFGVDISAPTTESTGVTMNLGFKNVDAAYVPVAVSKDGKNDISLVTAAYGEGDGEGESDQLQVSRIENLRAAVLGEQTATNNWKAATADFLAVQEYNKLISEGDTTQAGSLVFKNPAFKSAALSKFSADFSANKPIDQSEVDKLRSAQEQAQTDINTAVGSLEKAKKELADSLYVSRNDAMSVYGSFGSTTGTDSNSINNKLGKMFSTGVAAQNLTEGIKDEGRAIAAGKFLANCMEITKGLAAADQQQFSKDCAKAAIGTE